MNLRHHAYVLAAAVCLAAVACQPDTMPASAQGQGTHPVIQVPERPTLLPHRATSSADAAALSALSDSPARRLPMLRGPGRA